MPRYVWSKLTTTPGITKQKETTLSAVDGSRPLPVRSLSQPYFFVGQQLVLLMQREMRREAAYDDYGDQKKEGYFFLARPTFKPSPSPCDPLCLHRRLHHAGY
jgi:hypothetical protein